MLPTLLALFSFALVAFARDIIVTVGGNTTDNPGAVFEPRVIEANRGDVVVFNFTQGNHTAIQALFASPCIPAHEIDPTVNGFNSGFRDAGNFSAITQLTVPIADNETTIWFYDHNTCAEGGVGGININETSLETVDGFERNAIRLNGTGSLEDDTSTTSGPRPNSPSRTGESDAEPSEQSTATSVIVAGFTMTVVSFLAVLASL